LSVNVAARQLDNVGFAGEVAEILAASQLSPGNLCLELTETTLLEADRRVTQSLFALKDLGVRLAIDDFGTGYSSLTYLRRFPIDTIKIDRSFVKGVDTHPSDAEIVRAVIGLGQALGFTTIAEGVEHESQAVALRALGCDQAQGFYFGRAFNPAEFADRLIAAS
jgi:EAL domain-containing protein (putative c-di-GMP-specific phosphodiesterase class I)